MGLRDFDNVYGQQEATDPNAPVPPGLYQAQVTKVKHEITQKGKDVIKFQLKVIEGPCKGKMLFADRYLQGKDNESTATLLRMLKTDLIVCGAEHLKPSDFEAPAEKARCLIGVLLEVKVEQDGEFTRVRFRKRVEAGAGSVAGASGGPNGSGVPVGSVIGADPWGAPTDFNPGAWGG